MQLKNCNNLIKKWLAVAVCVLAYASFASAYITTRSIRESSCETLPSTIHISKEINNENGQLSRTCEGDIPVNKCEGTCASQLQPSVITSSGFLKDCQCCRESHLREREVLLQKCYDPDGQLLIGEMGQLVVRLNEPALCKCFKCGDD